MQRGEAGGGCGGLEVGGGWAWAGVWAAWEEEGVARRMKAAEEKDILGTHPDGRRS